MFTFFWKTYCPDFQNKRVHRAAGVAQGMSQEYCGIHPKDDVWALARGYKLAKKMAAGPSLGPTMFFNPKTESLTDFDRD